ncbi:MAG: hypothetical protein PHU85_07025 [Phycisphaerae bacterium]|nr:hypothetical protein [Phycisphaerae bacterium]
MARPRRHRPALTLVETMFSVLIMATVVVMAMQTFGSMVKSRAATNARCVATSLANQYMAEIVQNAYTDPVSPGSIGRESGETARSAFDDVDDYHNWTDSPPTQRDGTAIAGLTGWSRTATVEYLNPDTLAVAGTDTNLKRITVTVTDPRGVQTTVVSLRSGVGTYDQNPAATTNVVRWVGVELQLGSDSATRMVSGAAVPNIIPSGQ